MFPACDLKMSGRECAPARRISAKRRSQTRSRLDAQLPPMRPEKNPGGAERTVIFSVYPSRQV